MHAKPRYLSLCHAAGGVTIPGSNPLVCGGCNYDTIDESELCLTYNFEANSWPQAGYGVYGATKVNLNNSFILVGGGVTTSDYDPTILKYEAADDRDLD